MEPVLYPPITEHTFDSDCLMRSWAQSGFLLELYETFHFAGLHGHTSVAYRLYDFDSPDAGSCLIFEGTDYGIPAGQRLDDDDAVRGILGFLSCRSGDVEDDYFAGYTPRQMAWVADRAEDLSWWAMDDINIETGAVPDDDDNED